MSSHPPLVTVVIPTYNQADFLREALQSVVNQDLADWQAVVVNNYSTDHTKDVVAEIADPRIQIIDFNNEGVLSLHRATWRSYKRHPHSLLSWIPTTGGIRPS